MWSPDLENRFNEAVEKLGGLEEATPSNIRQEMNTDLTLDHIKSHLQKIRRDNLVASRRNSTDPAGSGGSRGSSANVSQRRSFDSAFPEACNKYYSSISRSRELSAQLENELAFLADRNFRC